MRRFSKEITELRALGFAERLPMEHHPLRRASSLVLSQVVSASQWSSVLGGSVDEGR